MPTQLEQSMTMILDEIDEYNNSLEHIGVKGRSGRYPLGSGERPYQGYGGKNPKRKIKAKGTLSTSKKSQKAYNKAKAKMEKILEKEDKKRAKMDKAQQKADKKAQNERNRILRDPAKLKKNQYDFDAKEINEALARFDWDEKLHQASKKKVERVANILNSFYKYLEVGMKYYNFAAGAHNAFVPDEKPWNKINVGAQGESKDKNKNTDKK